MASEHIPYDRIVFWDKFGFTNKKTISGADVVGTALVLTGVGLFTVLDRRRA